MCCNIKKKAKCAVAIGVSVCVLFIAISSFMVFDIYPNDDYNKENCTVTNVDYPTDISDKALWGECYCGKRCKSFSPKIIIYVTIIKNGTTYILNQNKNKKFYTFFNHSCRDANSKTYIKNSLDNAKQYYKKFNNQTIDCYFDDHIPFLDSNQSDNYEPYVFAIVFGVISCIGVCCLSIICCC